MGTLKQISVTIITLTRAYKQVLGSHPLVPCFFYVL